MQPDRRALNVLVVEDEAISAMAISDMLEDAGCRVRGVVHSGEDSIAMAARTGLDFVVMDIRLKGEMNGIEAAARLRERFDLPIVFTSAYSADELKQRKALRERVHFLDKPVTEAALQDIVELLRAAE